MSQSIRISCGGLCRVAHPRDGRLLLGLNRGLLAKGERVLKPLGGALHFHALPPGLSPTLENPAQRELRLFLPAAQVDAFAAWFAARTGRETSPFRELREELVDEYRALPALMPDDLAISYRHTVHTQRLSDRTGATGVLTHSYQEIFTVRITHPDVLARLLHPPPAVGLRWVTEADIRAGVVDGVAVQAKTLLEP